MKPFTVVALIAIVFEVAINFLPAFAANPVCVPGKVVGCGVCNAAGTAWANDNSKCTDGKICQNWACVAGANQIKSSFENATCTVLSGWICDPNNTTAQFTVDFYLDDTTADGYLGNAPANLSRSDISSQCGGSAVHGFSFALPATTSNGARIVADETAHAVHAAGKRTPGDWFIFSESPRTITCAACAPNCSGKACGSDGCGGSCGACASGKTCTNGACVSSGCTPDSCSSLGRNCGSVSDGCGATINCGSCSSDKACNNGVCGSCTAESSKKCSNGNLYWYDSCGGKGSLAEKCESGSSVAYRCRGTILQRENTAADCINNACTQTSSWSDLQDCSKSGKICKDNACVAADSAPATISGLSPSGTVYNSRATLSASTNETADCRFALTDKDFDAMAGQLASTDGKHHSAAVALAKYGSYTYYVRCKDASGNINNSPANIQFNYAAATQTRDPDPVKEPEKKKDATPPVISDLAPSGELAKAPTEISATTDENAVCKYDVADTDYDSMENKMEAAKGGTRHAKPLTEVSPGTTYNYYLRCQDAAGNKNKESAKISFSYVQKEEGPAMAELSPSSAVYQNSVALSLSTNPAAECRFATQDMEFDAMEGLFATSDGQQQQATVALNDFGSYAYYVRCKDAAGKKNLASQVINFEYKDPDPELVEEIPAVNQEPECAEYTTAEANTECSTAADCICDPDCANGDDPDCAKVVAAPAAGNNYSWLVAGGIVILAVIVILALLAVFSRKRNEGGEEEEGG